MSLFGFLFLFVVPFFCFWPLVLLLTFANYWLVVHVLLWVWLVPASGVSACCAALFVVCVDVLSCVFERLAGVFVARFRSSHHQPFLPSGLFVCLVLVLVSLSSVIVCPCWRFATSCFVFFSLLAVPCAYVVGGVSCGWVCCVCVVYVFLSLLFASSPKGASAHVMHAVLFLLVCPLASCLVVVVVARLFACVPCVHVHACVAAAGVGPGTNLLVCL